jgi:anti-anti-sigma factor
MPETTLHLDSAVTADIVTLTLASTVLGAEGAQAVVDQIDTHPHCATIRLHVGAVTIMTSAAIGALIVLHKRLASQQRQLELIELSSGVQEAMEFLKLDHLFTIYTASPQAS